MWGFQAAGAAPLVAGHPIDHPETIATAIRIGNPASWDQAIEARDQSKGRIAAVTDEQILAAHRLLSSREGVFVEPGSAASVAGLLASHEAGLVPAGARIVCTVTGHGLKDPQWALRTADGDEVAADPGIGRRLLGRAGPRSRGLSRWPTSSPPCRWAARSTCASPRAAPTSGRASTRSGSRSASGTTTS